MFIVQSVARVATSSVAKAYVELLSKYFASNLLEICQIWRSYFCICMTFLYAVVGLDQVHLDGTILVH